MKWFLGILGVIGAGALGYVAEPALREDLTGIPAAPAPVTEQASETEDPPAPEIAAPAPELPPAEETDPVMPDPPEETPPAPADELPAGEMASLDPEPAEEPAPAPAAEEPATEEAAASEPATGADVVAVMQQSIRGTEIKEFAFDQVKDWQAGEDETVDGTVFQTGLVSYEAETPLGTRSITAKAFIRNGKVERWIWPKSGMEIK